MTQVNKRLEEVLLSLRLVTQQQLDQALEVQRNSSAPLGSILVSHAFLTEDQLLNALATQIGVTPWNLDKNRPTAAAMGKVPAEMCRAHNVLPVAVKGDLLVLAMQDPQDLAAINAIRTHVGMRIEPVLVDQGRLVRAISDAHRVHKPGAQVVDGYVNAAMENFKLDPAKKKGREALTEADTRPVVSLIIQLLSDGIRLGASDVHIEPRADRVEVRYRIDGEMMKIKEVPLSLHPMLVTRLKIMAELDIVEFRIPQDGRVSAVIDGRTVDMRVSVLPNQHGQRIVLRVLDKTASVKTLDEIGFSERHLKIFRDQIRKPYGILLVTGPTGSGKTTTLYSAITELRQNSNNIMTCEDPIEYEMDGVNQSQVNEKVGLTFVTQLRAILRQDPDIIMVGEIRDGETAETAIRAALTGHLVLSTLHCNDAPSAVPRLLDMQVDPFLLSTCLIGVISQRLLRLLCPDCRVNVRPSDEERDFLQLVLPENETPMLWKPVGCPRCNGTGYRGRTAVHEVMPMPGEISKAISERASIERVRELAARYGYRPMRDEAMEMVLSGQTSLSEARRHVFFEAFYDVNRNQHPKPQNQASK